MVVLRLSSKGTSLALAACTFVRLAETFGRSSASMAFKLPKLPPIFCAVLVVQKVVDAGYRHLQFREALVQVLHDLIGDQGSGCQSYRRGHQFPMSRPTLVRCQAPRVGRLLFRFQSPDSCRKEPPELEIFAMLSVFTGMSGCTRKSISMRVESLGSTRTASTLPAFMPP